MIKEGSFPNINKVNDIPQKKEYSDEEINEKLSQGVDLGNDFALYLLKAGKFNLLIDNIDKFQNLDHSDIVLRVLDTEDSYCVFIKLQKFKNLNREVALKLIELNQLKSVAENLDKFSGLDQEVAIKIIDSKILLFSDKNNLSVTKRPRKKSIISVLFDCVDSFKELDYLEIAEKLIESGRSDQVAGKIDKFLGVNHSEIAEKLIESGNEIDLLFNLEKFNGLNHPNIDQEITKKLMNSNREDSVAKNLNKLQGINHSEIAEKLIESGNGDSFVRNLEKFQKVDLQEMANKLIKIGYVRLVAENLDKFQWSPQKLYEAIKEKYSDFITKIETKIPKLASQLAKSVELLLDILNIKDNFSELEENIAENPFLLDALEDNPRYGSKLILKYQEFDDVSKNNIKELFNNEAEMLKENPNIDKDSVEFRYLMQEKLNSYANNQEIIKELESHEVNTKEWLNYDTQTYFTLGEQEDVKFSDQIKTPITRIKETLNKYQDSIINVLSGYKKELQESFIPNPESEELKQKITELKQRIEAETDDKRIQGMQRGLTSLEAKEATLKPASVWSKVQSDIFRLKSMIDNIFKFHDACTTTETKIENTKDRKELIKEKDNLENNKTQLRDSFKEFELFFESYETKLKELIIPSLGQDRSDSLIQEIKETIGEELNHYDTDKNTLKNIFNEKPENENKLNGREMKISISSRSTQDLYLGNYCPCCICIDSGYHGAESPIADYVTDLGMQNIVIYDEKTNNPVLTCWTFIGENEKNGEPIMVIDNIEANTDYTSNYPEQLKEIISKYINDYAKSVNIKTIIQGLHNNDLEVFPLGSVGRKLGGKYNRADGYYLESEGADYEEGGDEDGDLED